MFDTILIANRGEIAVRVLRACFRDTVFTKGVWLGETLIMSGGDNRDGDPELADATAPPGWRVEVNRGTGRSWFMQEPT